MSWLIWACLLTVQSISFTTVSRARNSASLKRHMVAALFSNGVWFASQVILIGTMMDMLTGKRGLWYALAAGAWYTTWTLVGSITAHWWSLKTEKGKSAVGASDKYKQVTKEEWEDLTRLLMRYSELFNKVADALLGMEKRTRETAAR